MQHQNSLFHDLLKRIPWSTFDRLVDDHRADHRTRRLTTRDQLIALLYGQLAGASSLREMELGLKSHCNRLYHIGAKPISRSTLADANERRPAAVFSGLFADLVNRASRGLRRSIKETVHLIDSTQISLSSEWARFSADTCGVKAHIVYDPDADQPIYASVTTANVNDITAAKEMPIAAGATYIFDLGYYDYSWWAKMHSAGCRLVTRFKTYTPLHSAVEQPLDVSDTLLSDRIGYLNKRIGGGKPNPLKDVPIREVRIRIQTGKVLRLLTNDLKAPAQEIADLYKRRWSIELFFRWVKQHLKIKHFIGTSENAVRIHISTALIAYLLIKMAQSCQTTIASTLAFIRLVRSNLMHYRQPDTLLTPKPKIQSSRAQMEFAL